MAEAVTASLNQSEVCVFQIAYSQEINDLQDSLLPTPKTKASDQYLDIDVGVDAMLRNILAGNLNEVEIKDSSITISNHLYLLPGTRNCNKAAYEKQLHDLVENLLKAMDHCFDYVMVDLSGAEDAIKKEIIKFSDLNVFVLPQHVKKIEKLIDTIENKKKAFYVLGNYDQNSQYSIQNLKHRFHELHSYNSGVLPYSTEFKDAMQNCAVVKHFMANYESEKWDDNYALIKQAQTIFEKFEKYNELLWEV